MFKNFKQAFQQLIYFGSDYRRQAGSRKIRMFYLWLSRSTIGVFLYRFERMMYLIFGRLWQVLRLILIPILYPLQAYSNIDIGYKANIGPGILILHPSVGVVVSSFATIGKNLTLTGGNIIGSAPGIKSNKQFLIGDNVNLGANAVILGPIKLGDNITIGASAMVNKGFGSGCILLGVPATKLRV